MSSHKDDLHGVAMGSSVVQNNPILSADGRTIAFEVCLFLIYHHSDLFYVFIVCHTLVFRKVRRSMVAEFLSPFETTFPGETSPA